MIVRSLAIAAAMLAAVAASWALTPREDMVQPGEVRFADIIPREFGDWREVPSLLAQVDVAVRRDGDDDSSLLYDEVLTRSYRNSAGEVVMLSIAYGRRQRQEMKIHRPELCYAAQGFEVGRPWPVDLPALPGNAPLRASAMLATTQQRVEPVMFWIRIGDTASLSAWQSRLYILKEGLRGRVPDGVLVRTSQVVGSADAAEASITTQRAMVADLRAALSPEKSGLLFPL